MSEEVAEEAAGAKEESHSRPRAAAAGPGAVRGNTEGRHHCAQSIM